MTLSRILNLLPALCLLAACSAPTVGVRPAAPRTPTAPAFAGDPAPTVARLELRGAITLRQAVTAALIASPELRAQAWEIRAAQARMLQATVVPNPVASFELEEFAGSGPYNLFEQSQATLQISQVFDMSGRRGAAVNAAARGEELALWQLEARRLEIAMEAARRYAAVAVAQRRVAFASDALALAERTRDVVGDRVRAGKVPGTDETKARIVATNARIDHERARTGFDAARQRLTLLWSAPPESITGVTGSVDSIPSAPDAATLLATVAAHPTLTLRSVELAQRRSLLELERASTGLDLTLGGGVRYFSGTGDVGLVAGISLPIPFSNTNRGNIAEADARINQAEAERTTDSLRLVALITEHTARVISARAEVAMIRESLLPDATAAFEAVREGYTIGRFDLIDVLDAQRTLAATQQQYVAALESLHHAASDLDAITILATLVNESIDANP